MWSKPWEEVCGEPEGREWGVLQLGPIKPTHAAVYSLKQVGFRFSKASGACLAFWRWLVPSKLMCVFLFSMRFRADCDALTLHCTLHLETAWQFLPMRRLFHLYFQAVLIGKVIYFQYGVGNIIVLCLKGLVFWTEMVGKHLKLEIQKRLKV